jgi:hypothetical protein
MEFRGSGSGKRTHPEEPLSKRPNRTWTIGKTVDYLLLKRKLKRAHNMIIVLLLLVAGLVGAIVALVLTSHGG